jgi:hypothetical protein
MIHIAKYKFTSKEQFDAKLESLVDVKFDKAELGHIVLASAVVDEDGVEVTPEVISEGWHVDMIFHDIEDHPYGWKSYNVDLSSEGSHGFAGVSYLTHKF